MAGDLSQAQRLRVPDQQAKQPAALGPVVNLLDLLVGEPDGDELREPLIIPDDPERAVLGVNQLDRRFDDAAQHGLQFEAGSDGDHGFEQAAHPVPGVQDRLEPGLELG